MSPRGRRPGGEDTRGLIVQAARAEFAEQGYDGTSLRGVARRAGVDPALVHHYFDGKSGLFAEVMHLPVDPAALVAEVVAGPRAEVGERLARTFLKVWDTPEGRLRFQALIRSAVSHEDAARMLREFLVREVFARVVAALATDEAPEQALDAELRAGLAAGQMVGVAMMRYVLRFPAVAGAEQDALVALLAPVLQRYLVPTEAPGSPD